MGRGKEFAKNTAILTIGKICTQGISFLLLPLYTALLETSEYGSYDLMVSYGALLIPIFGVQMDQGLFRYMLAAKDEEEIKKVVTAGSVLTAFMGAVFLVVIVILRILFRIPYASFLIAYVLVSITVALLMQYARGVKATFSFAFASFISAAGTVVLNVLTLGFLKMQLNGLFVSTIAAQLLSTVYLLIALKPWENFDIRMFDISYSKQLLKYSAPLVPNQLSWWVVDVSDRTIVTYFLGVATNGIYSVANKFSNFYISFYNIFNLAWTETVVLHMKDEDSREFVNKYITLIYRFFVSVVLVIVAFIPFVFPIMVDEKYYGGYNQVPILLLAMAFRVVVGLYSAIYIAQKETKKVAETSIVCALINIVVNVLLIKRIGLFAASVSTLVAFASMSIARYADIFRRYKICISMKDIFISVLLGVIFLLIYYHDNVILKVISAGGSIVFFFLFNREFVRNGYAEVRNRLIRKNLK